MDDARRCDDSIQALLGTSDGFHYQPNGLLVRYVTLVRGGAVSPLLCDLACGGNIDVSQCNRPPIVEEATGRGRADSARSTSHERHTSTHAGPAERTAPARLRSRAEEVPDPLVGTIHAHPNPPGASAVRPARAVRQRSTPHRARPVARMTSIRGGQSHLTTCPGWRPPQLCQ
jgi:hypothetical protein